jgi:hypothetical protein
MKKIVVFALVLVFASAMLMAEMAPPPGAASMVTSTANAGKKAPALKKVNKKKQPVKKWAKPHITPAATTATAK